MLTLFTIPKPFSNNHIRVIQENAIRSWKLLSKKYSIVLIGNSKGIAAIAKKLQVIHIPWVACNQYGTPLLNSAFDLARGISKNKYLCYLNADIILLNDFKKIFKYIPKDDFIIVGQRWDLYIDRLINYNKPDWEEILKTDLNQKGKLHQAKGKAGSDYFVFKKDSFIKIPALTVGRVGWDNWMIYKARREHMKVIDATSLVRVIHQNHDYLHQINKGIDKRGSKEGKRNISLAGGERHLFNLNDCNYKLTKNGLEKKSKSPFKILKYIQDCPEVLPGKLYYWYILKPFAIIFLLIKKIILSIINIFYKIFINLNVKPLG